MKIDIAICTWNRARLLADTLESISWATLPEGVPVRIIVVDNNSTDDTSERVRAFENSLVTKRSSSSPLSVKLVAEPQQGHTYSRNRAIAVADSDLLLWTDDDVSVDSNWVMSYFDAARREPAQSFWGGKIIPRFAEKKPDWIADNWESLKGCFAERDLGNDKIPLSANQLPYGANFAVRTDVQKQFLYNVELGRRENSVLGEDEIDMFQKLLEAGHRGSWVPESSLHHIIESERATETYVYQYFVGQGRALVEKGEPWTTSFRKLNWQRVYEYVAFRFKRQWAASPAWVAHLIRSGLAEGQYLALKSSSS